MNVGERIKQRRLELNLSQEELAKKVGYKSRSSINKIELSRDLPLRKVELMAKALDTTPSDLMGWTYDPNDFDPESYERQQNRLMAYFDYMGLLDDFMNRQLLDAADGCTDNQKQVAIDMLNAFKKKE